MRIFPLYYGVLFLAALCSPELRSIFWVYFTYTTNLLISWRWDGVGQGIPLGPFWSLAVEEQFYILWPAVVLLVPLRRLQAVMLATIALSIVIGFLILKLTMNEMSYYVFTLSCTDSLAMGGLIALLRSDGERSRSLEKPARVCLVGGLILLGICIYLRSKGLFWAPRKIAVNVACTLLFAWLIHRAADGFGGIPGRFLRAKPLRYIGSISYGIYVSHASLPLLLTGVTQATGLELKMPDSLGVFRLGSELGICIGVASVSWFAYEKPLNDLKRYFPYTRRKASSAVIVWSSPLV